MKTNGILKKSNDLAIYPKSNQPKLIEYGGNLVIRKPFNQLSGITLGAPAVVRIIYLRKESQYAERILNVIGKRFNKTLVG